VCGPYRFGEVRVAEVALLIFTVLSGWRSCGVPEIAPSSNAQQ
jgi:hypothetical protein